MPTFVTGTAKPPTESRLVDDALAFGRQQWTAICVGFFRQWSQPAFIKLAELTLGSRSVHSSQIHGNLTGKLRDHSPKLIMALGEVNLALAAANGADVEHRYSVPMHLPELWQDKNYLKDALGRALGPAEIFQAITGLIDLEIKLDRQIPYESEKEVSQHLGKFLRLELAKNGVDWMGDMSELITRCRCIEPLLYGRQVSGGEIIEQLPTLAEIVEMDPDQLWTLGIAPALR